jgi:hypothetical protein
VNRLLAYTPVVPLIIDELYESILIAENLEGLSEFVTHVLVFWVEGFKVALKCINVVDREGNTDRPTLANHVLQLDHPSPSHADRILAPLLLALGRAGIELATHPTDAARLRHRPADLPPDLSARLRMHRAAVLRLLAGCYADHHQVDEMDAGYVLGERLGVADGLGMPTHPGSVAWLVAVGESAAHSCEIATHAVHCGRGSTDEGNSSGGEGERRNALRDRQGCESGP